MKRSAIWLVGLATTAILLVGVPTTTNRDQADSARAFAGFGDARSGVKLSTGAVAPFRTEPYGVAALGTAIAALRRRRTAL